MIIVILAISIVVEDPREDRVVAALAQDVAAEGAVVRGRVVPRAAEAEEPIRIHITKPIHMNMCIPIHVHVHVHIHIHVPIPIPIPISIRIHTHMPTACSGSNTRT